MKERLIPVCYLFVTSEMPSGEGLQGKGNKVTSIFLKKIYMIISNLRNVKYVKYENKKFCDLLVTLLPSLKTLEAVMFPAFFTLLPSVTVCYLSKGGLF
jgi:hypothetical protein